MSTEKEKLDQLLLRVEEIASSLSKIMEDLRSVSLSLKSLAGAQVIQPAVQAQAVPPQVGSKMKSVDDIRMSFPEELEARLSFEDRGEYIIIKPKQFLGSENFAKIASAVRGMGGEYISAGKDSHFRVPQKKA
jgi:hypothetical protein